jgi:hypothetical protein
MVLSRPHDCNRKKLRYAAPYHAHLNRAGSNGRPGPHLFTGTDLGPRNLLHHDTMSGYGHAASATAMAGHHHGDDYANAQEES